MMKRNNSNSQAMHNNMNTYRSYPSSNAPLPPPIPHQLPQFDSFQPEPSNYFDANNFGVFSATNNCDTVPIPIHHPVQQAHIPNFSAFSNIPTITTFNFNNFGTTQTEKDYFVGYNDDINNDINTRINNQCARIDINNLHHNLNNLQGLGVVTDVTAHFGADYDAILEEEQEEQQGIDPIPPAIDNAQMMQPHYSFCSETSNTTNTTNSSYNSYSSLPSHLSHDSHDAINAHINHQTRFKARNQSYPRFNDVNPMYNAMNTNSVRSIHSNYTSNNSLSHPPSPPYYRFHSDHKHNNLYSDESSSTASPAMSGSINTIKQSPSFRSDSSIKMESPTLSSMSLSPTETVINNKNNNKNNNKPYKCPECGNRYKYKSSMKLHFKVHTAEAKVCKECGKKFPHEHKLRIHLRSHTGERPYQCDICPKAFSDKSNLNRHRRLHTGEKPYQCEFCKRRYSDSSALVDHRRRKHTKEKPYKCQFCAKTFAASSDLTSHLAVHSDIRPFQCNQCHKRFKRRSDVHKHMKTHQPKINKRKTRKSRKK